MTACRGSSQLVTARAAARTAEEKECGHLESCLTEYPIITVESMTSFLFFSISVINNNTQLLSEENLVGDKTREENKLSLVALIRLSMCSFPRQPETHILLL